MLHGSRIMLEGYVYLLLFFGMISRPLARLSTIPLCIFDSGSLCHSLESHRDTFICWRHPFSFLLFGQERIAPFLGHFYSLVFSDARAVQNWWSCDLLVPLMVVI